MGKGTYGSKVGRPPAKNGNGKKKSNGNGKGSKAMKDKMAKMRAMRGKK